MMTRVSDLPKGSDKQQFGRSRDINRSSFLNAHASLSYYHVSSGYHPSRNADDLAKKAKTCLPIEEHKQERNRIQPKLQMND